MSEAAVSQTEPSKTGLSEALPVPVIDITDLYHPHQDPGDHFDLVTPYALPDIDLRVVILDIFTDFLRPEAETPFGKLHKGPRAPGLIPVTQLNSIFDRRIPCAVTPYSRLRHPEDNARDAPEFDMLKP